MLRVNKAAGLLTRGKCAIEFITFGLGHAGQTQRGVTFVTANKHLLELGQREIHAGRTKGLHDGGVFNALKHVKLTGQLLDAAGDSGSNLTLSMPGRSGDAIPECEAAAFITLYISSVRKL